MATNNKSRLLRDPNIFDDARQVLDTVSRRVSAAQLPTNAVPYATVQAPEPSQEETQTPTDSLTDEQRARAQAYGRAAGEASAGYLGERKRLAPGVRRWGSRTEDPAEIYMTVDKNGNRVYTDDAKFAASKSRGSLTRRDLAPGMNEADRDTTLNDPEGGFTYAPASARAVQAFEEASNVTRGGSKWIERALGEARRSQDIAAARDGNRPIDQQRARQASSMRRNLFNNNEPTGGLSLRDLLALQSNNRAERQLDHQINKDKGDADRATRNDDRNMRSQQVQTILSLREAIKEGNIDPDTGYAIIGSMVQDINTPAGRAAQQEAIQRLRDTTDANNSGFLNFFRNFGFDSDEAQDVTLDELRLNPDGSGRVLEPDVGLFDEGDNTGLSRRDLQSVLGDDELAQQLLRYQQNRRAARGD